MIKPFTLICLLLFLNSFKNGNPASHFQNREIDTSKVALVKILPTKPLIEKDIFGYYLNFDIVITNQSKHVLDLKAIEASVVDGTGKLLQRKFMNRVGQSPGIDLIGNTVIKPGETISFFNPFHTYTPDLNIAQLKFGLFFDFADTQLQKDNNKQRLPIDFDASIVSVIKPVVYIAKTVYHLPIKGKMIVWDGHDFYAHHRRLIIGVPDMQAKVVVPDKPAKVVVPDKQAKAAAPNKQAKAVDADKQAKVAVTDKQPKVLMANSNRYAYDLVSVDGSGSMYQNNGFKKQDWYVYGKPVYAPSSGKVIEVQNNIPDNEFDGKTVKSPALAADADPMGLGNHIIIDHGNGEFSALLHLEKGSVRVKVGQMVSTDQEIGTVGFSGDAIYPHLHYMVMNGRKIMTAEGLPSYFNKYKLYRGDNVESVKRSRIDSGDIVESLR
jgi:hypothetical protein